MSHLRNRKSEVPDPPEIRESGAPFSSYPTYLIEVVMKATFVCVKHVHVIVFHF